MIAPDMPANEVQRQAAVDRYNILDSLPEENYDNITDLIAHVADAPVSLITMLDKDRNFLKSHHGVPMSESPREISFCGHAINSTDNITVVEDATLDLRFQGNPLVTDLGVRFYAGVPLTTPDNYRLGTLCVFDYKVRSLNDDVRSFLLNMARQVEALLEQRYQNRILIDYRKQLEVRNAELEKFAKIAAHDIKSPIVSTLFLAQTLGENHSSELTSEAAEITNNIVTSLYSVCDYIDGTLEYYTSDKILLQGSEPVDLENVFSNVRKLTATIKPCELTTTGVKDSQTVVLNKGALLQILVNLVTNAVKFCDKDTAIVHVDFNEESTHYLFTVSDNGVGISTDRVNTIFDLFSQGEYNAAEGSGIGLATVRKLVNRMGGEISVESEENIGSSFTFTIPKGPQDVIQ